MKVGVFVGKQSKPIVLLDFNSGPILFFAFNTKLPNMSYGNSKDFIAAKKVTTSGARLVTTSGSLDQESNTYPTVLTCHVPVNLRHLNPCIGILY